MMTHAYCACLVVVLAFGAPASAQVTVNGVSSQFFGAITATTVDTGAGPADVFLQNQNLRTTDTPIFTGGILNAHLLVNKDAIGATTTNALSIVNNTNATVGAQEWSGRFRQCGNGWKTNATAESQPTCWRSEVVPVQGAAAPTSNLVYTSTINDVDGGTVTLGSGGNVTASGTLSSVHGAFAGLLTSGTRTTATVDAATTFAVATSHIVLACTGAETVTTGTGGASSVFLTLEHTDTECTLTDTDAATANTFNLTGAATNQVGSLGLFMFFRHDGTQWQQVGESDNN